MRKTSLTISLIGAWIALIMTAHAQTNVWHDDFDQWPVGYGSGPNFTGPGTYGRIAYDFSGAGAGNPMVVITNGTNPDTLPGDPSYTHSNYCAFIFTSTNVFPPNFNFGWDINSIAAFSNTNTDPRAYTLKFDFSVQGDGINNLGGFVGPQVYVFGQNAPGAYSSGEYYGDGTQKGLTAGFFPPPGGGWVHVEMPLSQGWGTANANPINFLSPAFSFGFGAFMAGLSSTNQQEIDIANVEITEITPPLLNPTNHITAGKPGLRLFAQNSQQTYNQEGFGTVDQNQSWVGIATPANPVSYSVTMGDFNTANGFALYLQFVQNGNPGDPFGVYNGQNALVWTIQSGGGTNGFTTSVAWKTNSPASGEPNVAMPVTTTTSTNGVGTWTLTFTSDLAGTVTTPDGTVGTVTLPDEAMAADFVNPVIIDFGEAPNRTIGYGQWITFNKIAISNVLDGTEIDDFTQDTNFPINTTLWNPGFSLDRNSVVQVPPGKSYWMNWTTPANGFGLETKGQLIGGTNMWFSPNYYGSGVGASNSVPTLMGTQYIWTLVPGACFPTADGTTNGPTSPTAFFRLANPPPSQ
jgi:hypothetical protein